jgi:hypothetical protein
MSNIGIRLGLEGVQAVTSGLQRVQGSLNDLGAGAATLRSAVQGLAPALAAAFTVGGLVTFVKSSLDAIDAMNDLADATGASIEEISKLDQVARRNGQSLDQVGSMLVKFNSALKGADGKNGASIAMQAIGLEAEKLRQLDPAEALRQTAVALSQFADDGNKARIVQELFGKSVREAAPFLKDLVDSSTINAKVTAEQAAEAEKFNKQMALMSANVTDAARSLVSDLIPSLTDTLEKFNRFRANGGVLSGFGTLLLSQFKDLRIQATLEEIDRLENRLTNPNVTGFNRATIEQDLRETKALLIELQGEAGKARTELNKALGLRDGGAGRGDQINPPWAVKPPSLADIAAEQERRKVADATAAALVKQQDAYDKLRSSLDERISAGQLELQQGQALTEAQRLKIKLDEDYASGLMKLTPAQKAVLDGKMAELGATEKQVSADREALKAAKAVADARADSRRAEQQAIDEFQASESARAAASLAGVNERVKALQDEAQATDLAAKFNISLTEALERVAIARLEEKLAQYQEGSEPYLAVEREIKARRELVGLMGDSAFREGNRRAAENAAAEWQRASDQIGQSLADALMQGGKSAAEYIKSLFRTMILRPIIQAVVQPVVNSIGGFFGMGGDRVGSSGGMAPGAAGAGQSMGASFLTTIASGIGSLGKMFGSDAISSFAMGLSGRGSYLPPNQAGPTTQGATGAAGLGATVGSAMQTFGAYLQSFVMGRGIGQAISNGYSVGGSGNAIVNIGSLGGVIGGTIAGLINRAFGKKLKDFGFEGEFTAEGFEGNRFKDFKGGFFRSDSTNRGALDPELEAVLDAGAAAANAQISAYIDVLGLPAEQLEGFSQSIRVSLKGLKPEEAQQAIADAITAYQEALAQQFADVLQPFAEAGESAVETLQRLTILQTFAEDINTLGGVFGRVAQAGPRAVQQLAEFAGGLETLGQQITGFVTNYFSADEIAGLRSQEFVSALGEAGIGAEQIAGLDTREEFRALVESVDVSTEQGRQQLAALLGQAENFAGLSDYLQETGQTVTQAAMLAPDSDVLAPLFDANAIATDQLSAMTGVEAGVNASNGLLQQILDQLRGNSRGGRSTPAPVFEDSEVFLPGQAQGA